MLMDLAEVDVPPDAVHADVVVIGAGLAGLVMAARLRTRGLQVIVLESGARQQDDEQHPLNEVVLHGDPYRGADKGRYRCLGGTSTRWGGAMLPFQACDMGPHPAGWESEWVLGIDDLTREIAHLEAMFHLPGGAYELDAELHTDGLPRDFIRRSAKWPAFKLRNIATTLQADIASADIDVWLNATVTHFVLDAAGRLASVTAVSPNERRLTVTAPRFVVAAGAIESTRLLLLLDAQHDARVFTPDDVLGRYFHDHLTAPAAEITPSSGDAQLDADFGRRFEAGGMRDRRLEPTAELRRQHRLPAGFAHVEAISARSDGFAALRDVYRDLQRGSRVNLQAISQVIRDPGWLLQASWKRFARGRLLAPRDARYFLTLVIEQCPTPTNRITLSAACRDPYGTPLAQIDWAVGTTDLATFAALQAALLAFWHTSDFATAGALTPTAPDVWQQRLRDGGDIYHPGGSTRMGRSAATAVVDRDLTTFRVPNLHVVSTSVMPTGGGCNPSFMLMAFALRTADVIADTQTRVAAAS